MFGRAAELFDEVIVAVGANVAKNALFTPVERVAMLTEACAGLPGVRVDVFDGLLVDFCREPARARSSRGSASPRTSTTSSRWRR